MPRWRSSAPASAWPERPAGQPWLSLAPVYAAPAVRRLALLLLLVAGLAAADLDDRLAQVMRGLPAKGEASVVVADAASGVVLYAFQPDARLSLASTTKSLVAAAALAELGTSFTFRTRLVALGPAGAEGRIPGLGVIGGGDPCLDEHFGDGDPANHFRQWARQLRAVGVSLIDGDIVIDGRLFSGPIRPATYPQDPENLSRWYSAPASAFAWNDNCIEVRVIPTRPGAPCEVQVRPRSPRVQVVNATRTASGRADNRLVVNRDPDANRITVAGVYSSATAWFPVAIQDDPELLAGDEMKQVLLEEGVHVAAGSTIRLGAVPPSARPLAGSEHPLLPALTLMNQHSQNFYGEQILRLLGRLRAGEGSIAAGTRAVGQTLRRLVGPAADAIELQDGSGLSYGNRASAAAMAAVMVAMARPAYREEFYSTLKERDVGRVPVRVKTGTLAVATCLVGYVDPPRSPRRAFAILFNRGDTRDFGWAPRLRDQLVRVMAGN